MLFKIIAFAIIFVAARSFFRSWKMVNHMQNARNQNDQGQNNQTNKKSGRKGHDDAIDAEYTVVED